MATKEPLLGDARALHVIATRVLGVWRTPAAFRRDLGSVGDAFPAKGTRHVFSRRKGDTSTTPGEGGPKCFPS